MNRLFSRLGEFFKESWQELKRVNWPTKEEALRYLGEVLAFSFIIAIVLSFVDFGLLQLIHSLLTK